MSDAVDNYFVYKWLFYNILYACICVSTLVTTSVDQTARLWNVPDLSLKMELKCSNGMRWVWDAAFSDDSEYLITG